MWKYLIEFLYLILKYYLSGYMDVPLYLSRIRDIYITVQYQSIATGL